MLIKPGVKKIRVHALLDGRDVAPTSALNYITPLEEFLAGFAGCNYQIASGGGRMYMTMDRYNADWSMVERGWKAHVLGEGRMFDSATKAIEEAGGIMCITADHGNSDDMYEHAKDGSVKKDKDGEPKAKTSHSLNPVPEIIYDPEYKGNTTTPSSTTDLESHPGLQQ